MNIQDFTAQLHSQGFGEVLSREQPANYSMGDHTHPFDARALITAGDITLTVNGVATRYTQGTIFELAAGTPHEEAAGSSGVTYLVGRRETGIAAKQV